MQNNYNDLFEQLNDVEEKVLSFLFAHQGKRLSKEELKEYRTLSNRHKELTNSLFK